ncbi:LamG domain-containing protein, partial [Candidatus Nitrosotalea bavarica]|uniref:LamG domain-containing protein n=1 Tax=Candidatus Nitrosotalea bavarica TaxID=1903277 RepID=UPI001055B62A
MKLGILISCLLLISVFSYAYADSIIIDADVKQADAKQNLQTLSIQNSLPTYTKKYFSINLNEKIGISANDQKPSSENSKAVIIGSIKRISLSEYISITTAGLDHNSIAIFKNNNMDKITTLEQLSYPERIRLHGKNILVDNYNANLVLDQFPIVKITNSLLTNLYYEKISYCCIEEKIEIVHDIAFVDNFLLENNIPQFYQLGIIANTDFADVVHDLSTSTNPTILLLLVLLSSYLLYSYEDVKIKYNRNRIFSFCFILILALSSIFTPFSISQSYWGYAYGEVESNSSGAVYSTTSQNSLSLTNLANSSNPHNSLISQNTTSQTGNLTSLNGLNINPPSTSTRVSQNTKTSSPTTPQLTSPVTPQPPSGLNANPAPAVNGVGMADVLTITVTRANSTTTSISSLPTITNSPKNATSSFTNQVPMSDSVLAMLRTLSGYVNNVSISNHVPLSDSVSLVTTNSNGTKIVPVFLNQVTISDSVVAIKPGVTVPNATQSWKFNSINSTNHVGNVAIVNSTNGNSLQLQGNGYLTSNLTQTKILKNFTISAWVKPDYSQGSPVFTVVSKENEFSLTINNNINPRGVATFSVYDGIKWTTVNSTVQLNQTWSHLVSTYDGSTISIYVNGTLQSTTQIKSNLVLADDGDLVPKTPDQLSSNKDLVIGAFVDSARGYGFPLNSFSGLIQKVSFYEPYLNQQQVGQLYTQELPAFAPPAPYTSLVSDGIDIVDTIDTWLDTSNLNTTSLAAVPTVNSTQQTYLITQNPEFIYQYLSDAQLLTITPAIKPSHKQPQTEGWSDSEKSISIEITGPDGKKKTFSPTISEIRQGKYDIKVPSMRDVRAGIYNVKITMVRNGQKFVTNSQYQWGLVSVNTDMSTYKPGDVAKLILVVLNSTGNSVCNSNILMTITDPQSKKTTLATGLGITPSNECGLYNANYTTTTQGNYSVNVSAQTQTGYAFFTTSFLAQNYTQYQIIRQADSKIDPVDYANNFKVTLDVQSFVGNAPVVIREYVPANFTVTTDGQVNQTGDTKVITWLKNLGPGNSTNVSYNYSVPKIYPKLYALGKAQIGQSNSTYTEARNWFVAVDPLTTQVDTTTAANTNYLTMTKSTKQNVCISSTVCYSAYITSANNAVMAKSTDGGNTWGAPTALSSGLTVVALGIWYDRWTPGNKVGNNIHVIFTDSGNDRFNYVRYSTNNDSATTSIQTDIYSLGTQTANNDVGVTEGSDGTLYAMADDTTGLTNGHSFMEYCPSSCTVAANWTEAPQPFASGNKVGTLCECDTLLLPLNNTNIMMLMQNVTTATFKGAIAYNIYQRASNTTQFSDFQVITGGTVHGWKTSSTYRHTLSGAVDPLYNTVYISYVNNTNVAGVNTAIGVWKYVPSSSPTWTQLTKIPATNSSSVILDSSIGIANSTGLYVAYSEAKNVGTDNIYYAVSLDGGNTWTKDQQINDIAAGDFRSVSIEASSDTSLHVMWQSRTTGPTTIHLYTDTVTQVAFQRESMAIVDQPVVIVRRRSSSQSDSMPLSDALTIGGKRSALVSYAVPLSDVLSTAGVHHLTLNEASSISDTSSRQRFKIATETDSMPLSDQLTIVQKLSRSYSDAIPLSDKLTIMKSTS